MISAARYAKLKTILYKCTVYAIALFLIAIAQATFFSRINFFSATPDLLLAAIVLLCLKEEHKIASICAIISGLFYCAIGTSEYPVYILFSFLCGYIIWIVAERSFGKSYFSYLALSAMTFGIKGIFNILYSALFSSTFTLPRIITSIVLPEFASSMLFCSISFLVFSFINMLVNRKSKNRKESFKNGF